MCYSDLRALLEDLRDKVIDPLHVKYNWTSYYPEDIYANDRELLRSDKRTYQNYSEENVGRAIATLNMNAFNYKNEHNQTRLIVRAWAKDGHKTLFNFDMTEIFGNRPPELAEDNIGIVIADGDKKGEVVTSSTKLNPKIGRASCRDRV